MKFQITKSAFLIAALGAGSFSANANELDLLNAKNDMASAITKMGLLTNSFTEQGKQSPSLTGMKIAQGFAKNFDDFIVQRLQQNQSCSDIQNEAEKNINAGLNQGKDSSMGAAAEKASKNVEAAMKNYIKVQCANLTE